jgi:hypothetical protein
MPAARIWHEWHRHPVSSITTTIAAPVSSSTTTIRAPATTIAVCATIAEVCTIKIAKVKQDTALAVPNCEARGNAKSLSRLDALSRHDAKRLSRNDAKSMSRCNAKRLPRGGAESCRKNDADDEGLSAVEADVEGFSMELAAEVDGDDVDANVLAAPTSVLFSRVFVHRCI